MSLFGEIEEPSTRTAWEDWDEAHINSSISFGLKWKNQFKIPEDVSLLLVLEGKYLSNCIKSREPLKLEHLNCVPEVGLELYKDLKNSKFICIIKDYDILLSSEITCLLAPLIQTSKEVITMQTKPLAEYKSSLFTSPDCIIRSVSTIKSQQKTMPFSIPRLEQPNLISGISAGVITLRQHLDLPGTAIVCYIEYPEEYQIKDLQNLLLSLDIVDSNQPRSTSILNSNLYI